MASSVSGGGLPPQAISVVVSSAPSSPAVVSEGSRRRISQIRLVDVDGVERQNYCCSHWFPTSKSYQRHLTERANEGDKSHELRLVEMGLVRCPRCPTWVTHDTMNAHLRKAHGIVKVAKAPRLPSVEVPPMSTKEPTPGNSYVIKVSGGSSGQAGGGEGGRLVGGITTTKPSTVKLVTTSGKLYHKLHTFKSGGSSSSSSSVLARQGGGAPSYPVVSMGPRIVMKSVPGGGIINLGTVAGANKLLPNRGSGPLAASSLNGISTVHLSGPRPFKTQPPAAPKTVILQNKVASVNGQNFVKNIANIKTKKVTALVSKVPQPEGSCEGVEVTSTPVLVAGNRPKEKSNSLEGSEAPPARSQHAKKSRKQVLNTSLPDLSMTEEVVTPSPRQKMGKKAKQPMAGESRPGQGGAEHGRSPSFTPKGHRRKSSYLMEGESLFRPGQRAGKKKSKQRRPGRPRKVEVDDSPDLSEIDSLFDEVDNEDLENKPIVRPMKGRKAEKKRVEEVEGEERGEAEVPTVELNLFTLPSLNEQVSVLLTEPKNPNFKVYASMDAIFVGDSALGDVTNQLGYVTDANSVVYVNPSHFLFPNVDDLENFVPTPILTMKGSKGPSVRQWKLNPAGSKSAPSPPQIPLKEVANNSVSKEAKKCDNNPVERLMGDENSTPVPPHKKKQSPKVRQKESPSTGKCESPKSVVGKVSVVESPVSKSALSPQTTLDDCTNIRTPKKKNLLKSMTDKEKLAVLDGNSDSSTVASVSDDSQVASKSPMKTDHKEKIPMNEERMLREEENVEKPVSLRKTLGLKKVRVPLKKLKVLTKKGKNMTLKVELKPLNVKPADTEVQNLPQKLKNLPKKKEVVPEVKTETTEPKKGASVLRQRDLAKKVKVKVLAAKGKKKGKNAKLIKKGVKNFAEKRRLKAVKLESKKSELNEKMSSPKEAVKATTGSLPKGTKNITEGPAKDVSRVVEENLKEGKNQGSKRKKVNDAVTSPEDSVVGSLKVAQQRTEPINGTSRSPLPKKKILISIMPPANDIVGGRGEEKGEVVTGEEQGRDISQGQGGRGNSRLGRRRSRPRTKSAEDVQGANSYKSRRKLRQLSESSVFMKELENLENGIASLAELRQRLGCEPLSLHSVIEDQADSGTVVHIGKDRVDQTTYPITPTSRSPSTDSEATLSASSRERGLCSSEPSTDSEATLSASSSIREGDTTPEVMSLVQEAVAEKKLAKRASKRKLGKQQQSLEVEPLKAVKVNECARVEANSLATPAEAASSPEMRQAEVVRPVRDRRPSFKLVENVALANPSPKRNSSAGKAESGVTRTSAKADSGLAKSPAKAESGVTKSPAKAESGVTKSPVKADSTVTKSPAKTDYGVTKSPAKVDSSVTKSPAKADSSITKSPAKADSSVTKSPAKADSSVTKSPAKADSSITKSPAKAESGVTKSPAKAKSGITKSPTNADSGVTKSPAKVDSGVTKSPTKADSEVTKSPSKADSSITKSPAKAESGVTKSPAKAKSGITKSPTNADSGVTKSPAKGDSGAIKSHSKAKCGVIKSPAKADSEVTKNHSKADSEDTKSPARAESDITKSLAKVDSGVTRSPGKAESRVTESVKDSSNSEAALTLSCVPISMLLEPSAGSGESATEEPREWHGRGAKLKAQVLIQDQQTGVTDSQVPTSLTPTLAHAILASPAPKMSAASCHSPSPKSPTTSPREWQARGAKLKAQVMISDPESSVVPYTSPLAELGITTPTPPKKLKTESSPGIRDIRSFFTVTRSPGQREASARSPGQQHAVGRSSGMQQAAGRSPGMQQASGRSPGMQQASGRSPGMQQAAAKSPAQQQAVDVALGQQQLEEDTSPYGKVYSKAFGPPASMASRKRMRRHSHTRADIRSYFSPAAVAKRKLLSPEKAMDGEGRLAEMAIPPSLLVPPTGGSPLTLGSLRQVPGGMQGSSQPLPEGECDFEGFERCSRRSGIRAKNLLRNVSLIEMRQWYNLGKFPFPMDQLCDWTDDELLNSLIFDQNKGQ